MRKTLSQRMPETLITLPTTDQQLINQFAYQVTNLLRHYIRIMTEIFDNQHIPPSQRLLPMKRFVQAVHEKISMSFWKRDHFLVQFELTPYKKDGRVLAGLIRGASYSPTNHSIHIWISDHVPLATPPPEAFYQLFTEQLNASLLHERTHYHQIIRREMHTPTRTPHMGLTPSTRGYAKSEVRKDVTPDARYLGHPEELMAHTQQLAAMISAFHNHPDLQSLWNKTAQRFQWIAYQIGSHPLAWKRFLRYLIEGLQRQNIDDPTIRKYLARLQILQ